MNNVYYDRNPSSIRMDFLSIYTLSLYTVLPHQSNTGKYLRINLKTV